MAGKRDGVSLRAIQLCLIVGVTIICVLMLFSTYQLSVGFRRLTKVSEQQIELSKASRELMDASDYLTEKVQRFTVLGDLRYLDDYFTEVNETKRREKAIDTMHEAVGDAAAYKKLQAAMNGSLALMEREYYAMRLVIEARGYTEYPEVLRAVKLSPADAALSPEEKMTRAAAMVHDTDYYEQKDAIRDNMRASLDELEETAYGAGASALRSVRDQLIFVRVVTIVQTVGILFLVILTSRLGIRPVLNAVERIKADSRIPEAGANEFRYLVRAYNKMYEVYRDSLEHLNFKASHDELTGAYNRAKYDILLSDVDLPNTCMLLFDVDDFKSVNDTYGHDVGDKILVKLSHALRSQFRFDDYVCRIGGDEFVVFMKNAGELRQEQIAKKIDEINAQLAATEDGLPAVSVSVGIVHGSDAASGADLFEKTDAAMYEAKQSGKHTHKFYEGKAQTESEEL